MSSSATILEVNQALADRINTEGLANPQSPYAGKYVGIANGQVVAVADDLREALRLLLLAEPDRQKTLCFEAGIDYNQVEYIWELC